MSEATESRFEKTLKIVLIATSAISAVLALVPQTTNLFGPFDYGAETLLAIATAGLILYGAALLRSASRMKKSKAKSTRLLGLILIVAAPIVAVSIWFTVLRLSADKEEMVRRELALGDTELNILKNPAGARDHYRNALLIAPRRGSIRVKLQDAEDRIRLKGN